MRVHSDDVAGRGVRASRAGPGGCLLQRDGWPCYARAAGARACRERCDEALGDLPLRARLPIASRVDVAVCRDPADAHVLLYGDLSADYARSDGSFVNGPFIIAVMSLLGSMIGLLIATGLTGEAAARDVQARMDPLLYTTPVQGSRTSAAGFWRPSASTRWSCSAVPLGLLLARIRGQSVRDPWSVPSGGLPWRVLVPAAAECLRRDAH